MGLIDTHTHLNEPRFVEDVLLVRERAHDAGVTSLIIAGYDLSSSKQALDLASQLNDGAAVGIHPHDAKHATPEAMASIREMANSPQVVSVGETGLDYHYDHSPRDIQQDVFRQHIRLARELRLPLIMHCREAYPDLIRILEEENAGEAGGVAHCFFGDAEEASILIEMGFYLGLGGAVTFPKNEPLRTLLKEIPRDRILIETDCPYMAPVPHRGQRNEPAFTTYVADKLAEIYDITREQIDEETTANALRCFSKLRSFL